MVKKVEVDVFQSFKNSILRNPLTESRSYSFEAPAYLKLLR